jgi:hypothetical protein
MAMFADYQVVVPASTIVNSQNSGNFAVSYPGLLGRPLLLDFQALGGFRADPADPTGQTGLRSMNLEVFVDGRLDAFITVHRWTEHLEMIPDRPLVIIPPTANRISHVLFQAVDPTDYFFVGPVVLTWLESP